MKRSDMIKILTTPITVSGEVDIDLWLFNDEAEAILSMIEEAGMLPPKLEVDPKGPWDDRMFGWEDEE